MKKLFTHGPVFLLLAILPGFLPAQTYAPFSLSLDLAGQDAFAGKAGLSSLGEGAQVFGDWRLVPTLSLGTGFSYMNYSGQGGWNTASWDLGGRIFPFGAQADGDLYLQGGLGLNLSKNTLKNTWPGTGHATACLGYRLNALGPGMALDFGAVYDFNNPLSQPLQALGAKAGVVWYLGGNSGAAPAAVSKPAPPPVPVPILITDTPPPPASTVRKIRTARKRKVAPPVPAPSPTPDPGAPDTYTWTKGDNLSSIAVAYYGEEDLFPILVDANKAKVLSPGGLKPGVVLLVPKGVSEADKAAARGKAVTPEYDPWKKWGTTPSSVF